MLSRFSHLLVRKTGQSVNEYILTMSVVVGVTFLSLLSISFKGGSFCSADFTPTGIHNQMQKEVTGVLRNFRKFTNSRNPELRFRQLVLCSNKKYNYVNPILHW